MSIVVMWQHNVYYVCVTFSVVRYVGLCPNILTTLNVTQQENS